MTIDFTTKVLAACSLSLFVVWLDKRKRRSSLPLPPGPKKLPIVGNLFEMPKGKQWETYHEWCQEFDTDILHLDAAGTSIIVLDSAEAVSALLDKRSVLYSGRTPQRMVREVMGWDFIVSRMPYGERWRRGRRYIHQAFHPVAALQFRPQELKAAHALLRRLLDPSRKLDGRSSPVCHSRCAGATILRITYGLEVLENDDPHIAVAEKGLRSLSAASLPGTFLVDFFPWLKHIPSWMPGGGFKKNVNLWKADAQSMLNSPFEEMKKHIEKQQIQKSSYAANALLGLDQNAGPQEEASIKESAATLYAAGTDTTLSALSSCFLGLLENPDILKKAQQQIDEVIGSARLPTFDDYDSLPYITALVKEALRWRDVTPLGVSHLAAEEDEYKGYRIPAKSMIIPNQWAILHDRIAYPEPHKFNPERFLKEGKIDPAVRDPAETAFGFGRRICPGRHMAVSSMWITLATMLAAFDITKKVDEDGNIVPLTHEYVLASIILPHPYECSITPRSKEAEELIKATAFESYE